MPSNADKVAVSKLQSVLSSLESSGNRPGVGLIESIKITMSDVIDIINEGDPVVRRLLICMLVVIDATEIVESKGAMGKTTKKVRILDQDAYKWALVAGHKIRPTK